MQRIEDRKIHVGDLPLYGLEDWKYWEGKWELIEGIPFAMVPMPSKKHQRINGNLYRLLAESVEICPDCEVFLPVNFKVSQHNLLHPDLMVVCGDKEDEMYVTRTPHLVVEILSPYTYNKDLYTKPKIYSAAHIPYYLIVDPMEEIAKLFELKDGAYAVKQEGHDFQFQIELEKCAIEIAVGNIW